MADYKFAGVSALIFYREQTEHGINYYVLFQDHVNQNVWTIPVGKVSPFDKVSNVDTTPYIYSLQSDPTIHFFVGKEQLLHVLIENLIRELKEETGVLFSEESLNLYETVSFKWTLGDKSVPGNVVATTFVSEIEQSDASDFKNIENTKHRVQEFIELKEFLGLILHNEYVNKVGKLYYLNTNSATASAIAKMLHEIYGKEVYEQRFWSELKPLNSIKRL